MILLSGYLTLFQILHITETVQYFSFCFYYFIPRHVLQIYTHCGEMPHLPFSKSHLKNKVRIIFLCVYISQFHIHSYVVSYVEYWLFWLVLYKHRSEDVMVWIWFEFVTEGVCVWSVVVLVALRKLWWMVRRNILGRSWVSFWFPILWYEQFPYCTCSYSDVIHC